jgi:GTP pyrophosphokinase
LIVARLAAVLVDLRAAKLASEPLQRRQALAARVVYGPLANRLGIWQVKWELEDLAFRYLEPDEYQRIASALAERRQDRENYIAGMVAALKSDLTQAGITAEVYGRPKHIFSIWRKMQRKQLAFAQIFDVRALRIVCASVADCYAALGVVHGKYAFVPGEFDDYIATPKDNNYRSIHTAVTGPADRVVEIQIRTQEMHAQAELGLAAHWRYKEGGSRDTRNEQRIEWLRGVLGADGAAPATQDADYLDQVRGELFGDRVYALTPKGEVVDLPRNATPLDFAYQVHSGLGHRCRGAKVNGRIVALTTALVSGAVVEIITGKEESPSRDWLMEDEGYLVSPRSRAKVRAWFRKLDAADNVAAGKSIAERELQLLGTGNDLLSALVEDLKCDNAEQLYRLLGEGELSVRQLTQAAARRLGTATASRAAPRPGITKRPSPKSTSNNPIDVDGVGDLPVTLARCCAPMRPEAIAGYLTLGRGLTVHAARCRSFARMRGAHPERSVLVNWRASANSLLPVEVTVMSRDRRGLVRDLSEVIAAANLSIDAMNTYTDHAAGTAHTVFRFGVRDQAQLANLQRALLRVANVVSVRRSN